MAMSLRVGTGGGNPQDPSTATQGAAARACQRLSLLSPFSVHPPHTLPPNSYSGRRHPGDDIFTIDLPANFQEGDAPHVSKSGLA